MFLGLVSKAQIRENLNGRFRPDYSKMCYLGIEFKKDDARNSFLISTDSAAGSEYKVIKIGWVENTNGNSVIVKGFHVTEEGTFSTAWFGIATIEPANNTLELLI